MIDVLIKALRSKAIELNQTADSLQRLGFMLGPLFADSKSNENANTAKAILKDKLHRQPIIIKNSHMSIKTAKAVLSNITEPKKKENPIKGKTYPKGTHWTQKPENAAKLKRVVRKMVKANKG